MKAITKQELDAFYGVEATPAEVADAIQRQSQALELDDLFNACDACDQLILSAVRTGNAQQLLDLFRSSLSTTVARRASFEIFGNTNTITAAQVSL